MKKLLVLMLIIGISWITLGISQVEAYVSVKGHYRNGTWISPHVRSNPNGLKYDNYGYKPSQGLYNASYGTKGTNWDTPTYITDHDYYEGKSLYESNSTKVSVPAPTSFFSQPITPQVKKEVLIPTNASASIYSGWLCNSGYRTKYDDAYNKFGCTKIVLPQNASLSYSGSDWHCDSGYKTKYNNFYEKVGCEAVKVPENASLSYSGNDWSCNSGYKTKFDNVYNKIGCTKIVVPKNASLNYFRSDWTCNSGYKIKYNSLYQKVGCE